MCVESDIKGGNFRPNEWFQIIKGEAKGALS